MNLNNQLQSGDDEIQTEYDFSQGVRGKYHSAYQASSNVIILDPDLAAAFPNSAAVNAALRRLLEITDSTL
ncbi:MAG: hypothetical protein AAGG51_21470 [Cyanobacteria bacterium P01_G01_bin.54]